MKCNKIDKPLISIIVPVYNVGKYLNRCLDSIVNQTYKNLEIILVNDGSTDNSGNICDKYAIEDDRIRVIHQENFGQSKARNVALDIVEGEYLMFVDGDDWIETNTCEFAFETIEKYNADMVMWDYIRELKNESKPKKIFDTDMIFEKNEIKKIHRRMIGIYGEELKNPDKADALCTVWGKLYNRKIIFNNNLRFYDIRSISTHEDGLFNLQVFENVDRAVYVNKYLYHYRKDNNASTTSIYNEDLQQKHETLHEYMKNYILENKLGIEYETALNNRVALELVGYGFNILKKKNGKLLSIKKIISNPYYKESYKQLDFEHLPAHWKLFYGCAKYNFGIGVYILLLCMVKLRGKT